MIDEDPTSPRHPYEKVGKARQVYLDCDIKLAEYSTQGNSLVSLCPRLEEWILKTARIGGVDITRHGLPDDALTRHRDIDKHLDRFRILLGMLKKEKSPRLLALSDLLKTEQEG